MTQDTSLGFLKGYFPELAEVPDDVLAPQLYEKYKAHYPTREAFYEKIGYKLPGAMTEFKKGLGKAMESTENLAKYGLPATLGSLIGAEEYAKKKAEEFSVAEQETQKKYPLVEPSYADVEGFGEALRYIGGQAGQGAGSLAEMLLTGAATGGAGVAGKAVIQAGVKQTAKSLAKKAGKELTEAEAEGLAQKGVLNHIMNTPYKKVFGTGFALGAIGESYAANTGETYLGILAEGKDAPGTALLVGAAKSALDYVPAMGLFKRTFGNLGDKALDAVVEKGIAKAIGKEAFRSGWQEGLTEAAQEALDIAAEGFVLSKPELFDKDNIVRLIDAGIAGSLGGALFGTGGGMVQYTANQQPKSITDLATKAQTDPSLKPDLDSVSSKVDVQPTGTTATEVPFLSVERQETDKSNPMVKAKALEAQIDTPLVPADLDTRAQDEKLGAEMSARLQAAVTNLGATVSPEVALAGSPLLPVIQKVRETAEMQAQAPDATRKTGRILGTELPPITPAQSGSPSSLPAQVGSSLSFTPAQSEVAAKKPGRKSKAPTPQQKAVQPDLSTTPSESVTPVPPAPPEAPTATPKTQRSNLVRPNLLAEAGLNVDNADYLGDNTFGLRLSPTKQTEFNDAFGALERTVREVVGSSPEIKLYDDIVQLKNGTVDSLRGAQVMNTIYLAYGLNARSGYSNLETSLHEGFHYLWGQNAITQEEKSLLNRERPRLVKYITDQYSARYGFKYNPRDLEIWDTEELSSTAFGMYGLAHKENLSPNIGPATKVFRKLVNLLRRIHSAFTGTGFKTFEDIFSDTMKGNRAPSNVIYTAFNNNRMLRAQKATETARLSRVDQIMDTFEGPEDAESVRKALKQSEEYTPKRWMNKQGRWASHFMSMPMIANKYPVFAPIINHYMRKEADRSTLLKTWNLGLSDHLAKKNQKRTMNAASVMDLMSRTGQKLQTDSSGRVLYERNGSMYALDADTSSALLDIHRMMGDTMRLRKAAALQHIKELGFDPALGFEEIYAQIAAMEDGPGTNALAQAVQAIEQEIKDITDILSRGTVYFPQMRFGVYGVTVQNKDGETVYFAMYGEDLQGNPDKQEFEAIKKSLKEKGMLDNANYNVYGVDEPFRLNNKERLKKLNLTSALDSLELAGSLFVSGGLKEFQTALELDGDAVQEIYGDALKQAQAATQAVKSSASWKRHFLRRKNIDGASTDYLRVLPAYFTAFSHFHVNDTYAVTESVIRNAPAQLQISPELQTTMQQYIDYAGSPEADQTALRMFSFMYALGGNLSSAALQILTLPTFTAPLITQWYGNPISANALVAGAFKDASRLFLAVKADTEKLSDINFVKQHVRNEGEAEAIVKMFKRGALAPGNVNDYLAGEAFGTNTVKGNLLKHGQTVGRLLGEPIRIAEESSRIASFLAVYRSLNSKEALDTAVRSYSKEARFNHAARKSFDPNAPVQAEIEGLTTREFTAMYALEELHAIFGKVGRGEMQRGLWGSLVLPFMTHPQQMMELMLKLATQRGGAGRTALLYSMGTFFLLGGLMGLPGSELAEDTANFLYEQFKGDKIDLNYEMKKALMSERFLGLSPRMAEFVTEGSIKAFAGADISRRIAVPFFWQNLLIPFMEGRTNVDQFMGTQGSVVRNMAASYNQLKTGDIDLPTAAFEAFAPVALKNLWEASMIYPTKGVRSNAGTPIVAPSDLGAGESLLKGIGFQPATVSRAYQRENVERIGEYGYREGKAKRVRKITNLEEELRNLVASGASAERINKQRDAIRRARADLGVWAKGAGLNVDRQFWDSVNKNVTDQLKVRKNPLLNRREIPRINEREVRNVLRQDGEE